jgi:anti-sigma regulatory factor (Ser/Thr protein kinase)
VGRIITDLRPSILDHQGLWGALEWQAQEFVQSAEQELKWCMEVHEQRDLPEPVAMAVFRIFQEMLSNVGRHARARTVDVDIVERDGWLHLSVEDDGCGALPQVFESPQAYGILGMRERARHFGGVIDKLCKDGIVQQRLRRRPRFEIGPARLCFEACDLGLEGCGLHHDRAHIRAGEGGIEPRQQVARPHDLICTDLDRAHDRCLKRLHRNRRRQ